MVSSLWQNIFRLIQRGFYIVCLTCEVGGFSLNPDPDFLRCSGVEAGIKSNVNLLMQLWKDWEQHSDSRHPHHSALSLSTEEIMWINRIHVFLVFSVSDDSGLKKNKMDVDHVLHQRTFIQRHNTNLWLLQTTCAREHKETTALTPERHKLNTT